MKHQPAPSSRDDLLRGDPDSTRSHRVLVLGMTDRQRLVEAAFRWFVGTVVSWMLTLLLLQELLLPQLAPRHRGQLALLVAIPLASWLAWRHYSRRCHTVTIEPDLIELHVHRRIHTIRPAEVKFLLGVSGINLDGGDLIGWRAVMLRTPNNDYWIAFGNELNQTCFHCLATVCRQAWRLPFRGPLMPPQDIPLSSCGTESAHASDDSNFHILVGLRRHLRWMIMQNILLGFLLLLSCPTIMYIALSQAGPNPNMNSGLMWLIVLFVCGLMLVISSGSQWKWYRQIRQVEATLRNPPVTP